MESETVWITQEAAGLIAPGLTAKRLDHLRRESRYDSRVSSPPANVLSDGEVLYDELLFRRWLEGTVSVEWVSGHWGTHRSPPSEARRYTYQDADLDTLRRRTYVDERTLLQLLSAVPLWRIRDLRVRAVGPRFLKPSPKTVVYIAEEAIVWAEGVRNFADPLPDRIGQPREPFTPQPTTR